MLVELGLVEQRYNAVKDVLEGSLSVTEVAQRYGVARQTLHDWLRRYASGGLPGLVDRSCKPARCPHQMTPEVEVATVEMRREHPDWGPRRIVWELRRAGVEPVPGKSSVYRALVRHGLVDAKRRARRRSDYRRWERMRAMELWQMDIVGGLRLADGTELSIVTGIDDHSRFCVCARAIRRATAEPVCDALMHALNTHGLPESILTDNGKVFTGRFTAKSAVVRFDRICRENGVKHLLTAPYSPTTTGKIERLHKTLRKELVRDRVFQDIDDAQRALDEWVEKYNNERPHQAIGDVPPNERFRFAFNDVAPATPETEGPVIELQQPEEKRPPGITRWVDQVGKISVATFDYHVGQVFAGQHVEVVVRGGLVEILHNGVLVAMHVQKRKARPSTPLRAGQPRKPRQATAGQAVKRIVDERGVVYFAGTPYRAGRAHVGKTLEVSVVGGSVQLAHEGAVIRVHAARHDPAKEYGAFAVPKGRPPRKRRQQAA